MRPFLSVFILAFSCTFLSGQISFSQFPQDNQLYPRDLATNTAQVQLSGTLDSVLADSLVFSLERSDGLTTRMAFHLNDFPHEGFDFAFDIEALLQTYQFKAALKSADSTWLIASASNVVAGDVVVVQGQSNAQAIAYNGDANGWQSNYVRCFGNSDPANYTDQQWYIAEGNGYFTPGAVGQWALRMGSLLQEHLHIPIAVINGADPGKPIEFFQRNDALHYDPATNYGRLLQRLDNARLTNHVRAVIYYQGESDGDRAEIHKSLFEELYADWEADFQNVEVCYVVQVREGCGAPSLQLREYQRAFEDYLPRLKSVTANGIAGHDGCHYSVLGYEQLGGKMYKQLAGDLYNAPSGEQLNVRVLSAAYTNETNTQITLTTDASALSAQTGSGFDFKILGTASAVAQISTDGNKIILDLDQPVYDANASISYSGHAGDAGGWVLNGDGYGLFSFYDFPIENHTALPNFDIAGIMSGSGNCLALDGQDDCVYIGPVLGASYTKEAWVNWQGGGLGNNMISGAANTAFWIPQGGTDYYLAAGHNNAWWQVLDPAPMIPNQWTHVAVSYDDTLSEMSLYKNGNLVSQAQNVPPHNDPELYVGAFVGAYTFQGKMDEVRVWDMARSIEDIRAFMCQKLTGEESGLSSYFRFDQTGGITAQNTTEKQDGQLLGFQTP
ncbi:MAG: LamG-like jellyroll fold domain-containing protein, partial [Saprospiraceae bacterium]